MTSYLQRMGAAGDVQDRLLAARQRELPRQLSQVTVSCSSPGEPTCSICSSVCICRLQCVICTTCPCWNPLKAMPCAHAGEPESAWTQLVANAPGGAHAARLAKQMSAHGKGRCPELCIDAMRLCRQA